MRRARIPVRARHHGHEAGAVFVIIHSPPRHGDIGGRDHPYIGFRLQEPGQPNVPHQHLTGGFRTRRAEDPALGGVEGDRAGGGHGPGGDGAGRGVHTRGNVYRDHRHAPGGGPVDLRGPPGHRFPQFACRPRAQQAVHDHFSLVPQVRGHVSQT